MALLKRIKYFITVAEELNFRRASDRLNITQPALWRQMRELEDEINVKLFSRSSAGIKLTEAGLSYLADARRVLESLDLARARAQRIQ